MIKHEENNQYRMTEYFIYTNTITLKSKRFSAKLFFSFGINYQGRNEIEETCWSVELTVEDARQYCPLFNEWFC